MSAARTIIHTGPGGAGTTTTASTEASGWEHVGGDQGGSRYSPLAQIEREVQLRATRAAIDTGDVVVSRTEGEVGISGTPASAVEDLTVGARLAAGSPTDFFMGAVDHVRITPAARYTTDFTPPRPRLPERTVWPASIMFKPVSP